MNPISRNPALSTVFSVLILFCVSCGTPPPKPVHVENDGKLSIGLVGNGDGDFWKAIEYGANHAADDNDLHLIWKSVPVGDDEELRKKAIQNFIAQQATGIIVSPESRFELQGTLQDATDRGVFVVLLDTEPLIDCGECSERLSVVTTDQFAAGRLAADKAAAFLGGKGRLAVIRYSTLSTKTENREEGFLARIKEYPEIELVFENMYVGTNPESARDKLRTFLQLYCPNGRAGVDGIFVSDESTACDLLDLMQLIDIDEKIHFVTFGSDSRLVTGMLTYQVDALVVEQPVKMGELAVETMARLFRGETVEPVIDSGVYLITIDNLSTPYAQALLDPSSDETMETLTAEQP